MSGLLEVGLATLYVAAVWCATLLVLFGLGRLVQRLFGLRELSTDRVATAPWAGYALAIAFLQIWHLLFAVSVWAAAVLALAGLVGLWGSRSELIRLGRSAPRRPVAVLLGTLVFLWMANVATGPCKFGDTGMYHLPMARWLSAHPIVPGLANLHGRLGINNSNLLFAALFESGPFAGRSHHLTQGPLVIAFLLSAVGGARRWALRARAGEPRRPSQVFLLLVLAPLTYVILSRHFTSLSTDVPAALLILAASWRLIRLVEHDPAPSPAEDPRAAPRFETTLVAALLATAVTTKVPALPFAVLGASLALALLWRAERGARLLPILLPPVAAVLLFAIPWLLRGVLLSGLPVYPDTRISVPVEWRVPLDQADALRSWALDACRMNGQRGPGGPWLEGWLRHLAGGVLALVPAVTMLAWWIVLAGLFLLARRRAERRAGWLGALWTACLLSSLAWFFLGPNPRFGFGILWALAAVSGAMTVYVFPLLFAHRAARLTVLAVTVASCAYTVSYLTTDKKMDWRTRWLVLEPGADGGLHPYRSVEVEEYVTDSGWVLYVPTADSNNAWSEALPNTPYPAPNLRLRVPGDVSAGIVTEGEWQPSRWPKARSEYLSRWRALHDR